MKIRVIIAACLLLGVLACSCSAQDCEGFSISKIDDATFARIKGKSYKDNCPIPLEDLRLLHVLHKNLKGVTHSGELICNVYIADDLLEIFKALFLADYPIERVRLVDEYNADDETSMRDNNSSCFNFRFIARTTRISKHGLGLAVDINTLYNPYVKKTDDKLIVEPATATEYTDRSKTFPYKIEKGDLCYKLFTERGFEWGGEWKTLKDYQHFEVSDEVARKLYPDYR
ncbi:MAG: M15 family metallopeptidase [Synergistaceae bacterium]|nr:M15 family metallopeptidase [Synergistaceae bacterium]